MIEHTHRKVRASPTPEDAAILKRVSSATLRADRGDAEYVFCRVDAAIATGERFCRADFVITRERCNVCIFHEWCKHI